LQNTLKRYRRQDRALKLSVASAAVLVATMFAAPLLINQPSHAEIPLFKPYRADVVAQR
jgi:hypothetical protein